jgi:hypothetical protein
MEQQICTEFAKARQTLTIRPILGLLKVFTELKIQKSDYLLRYSKSLTLGGEQL